ncbi:poly(U)-specific endoribonuclease homolog [Panicum virgatum]|uniref:poly(U)-specific endoribonuclease homolog n=1 Tax=Panicum virgatum TaxID=38727 RepID=UPI0019D5A290|nr:poly(U)-specific endoribonuclease homolog [Panicum virgatum]
MGQYHDMMPAQHQSTLQKIVDMCKRFRRAVTCREDDTFLPPRSSGPVPVPGPSSRWSTPAAQSGPPPPPPDTMATPSGSAVRPTYVPRPAHLYSAAPGSSLFPSIDPYGAGSSSLRRPIHDLEYRQVGGTDDDEEIQEMDDLMQMELVNTFFSSAPTQEVVGTSQLGGAPLATQDYSQVEQTPIPEQGRRSTHETIPPEPLTYSQRHTRAGQAAERRGKRRGGKCERI